MNCQDEIAVLGKRLSEAEQDLAVLRKRLAEAEQDRAGLEANLTSLSFLLGALSRQLAKRIGLSDARFWDRTSRKYARVTIGDQAGYERTLDRTRALLGSSDGYWNWAAEQEQQRSALQAMCKAILRRIFPLE